MKQEDHDVMHPTGHGTKGGDTGPLPTSGTPGGPPGAAPANPVPPTGNVGDAGEGPGASTAPQRP